MRIIWTRHASDRQQEWLRLAGITRTEVETIVENPEQVVPGHGNALVAQSRRGNGLLRVPFAEQAGQRKLITVYFTTKVDRYWQE